MSQELAEGGRKKPAGGTRGGGKRGRENEVERGEQGHKEKNTGTITAAVMCSMTSLQSVDFSFSFWGRLMHNPCCTDSFRLYLFFILAFPKFYLHFPTDCYLDMHAFPDMLEIYCRIFQRHLKLNVPCPALTLIFL